MGEKLKGLWNRASTKTKLIIIAVIAGIIFTIIFVVMIIAVLMSLGIVNISFSGGGTGGSSSSLSYSDVKSSYWWPVGGSEITIADGKEYATGTPTCTNVSSNFGLREINNVTSNHAGMDISCAPSNKHNVIAALDGTVETVVNSYPEGENKDAGYGNYVKIKHNDGNSTIYAHMYLDSIKVNVGDHVEQGQVLGKMGNSGDSSEPHLHFEIRTNGIATDPANFISSENSRPKSISINYIDGNSNKQTVCLSLKANKFSNNGTIALVTNIYHESNFNPNVFGDGGTSYGLCQWHNERYTNLQNTFPNNYQTIEGQIQFLIYELENSYPGLHNNLLNGNLKPYDLTYQFCKNFERPADTENTCKARAKNAVNFTSYVINNCQ